MFGKTCCDTKASYYSEFRVIFVNRRTVLISVIAIYRRTLKQSPDETNIHT